MNETSQIVTTKKYNLPDYSSNYEAEVLAIQKAIEFIAYTKDNDKYQLFTDILSALQALKNSLNANPMINAIKK